MINAPDLWHVDSPSSRTGTWTSLNGRAAGKPARRNLPRLLSRTRSRMSVKTLLLTEAGRGRECSVCLFETCTPLRLAGSLGLGPLCCVTVGTQRPPAPSALPSLSGRSSSRRATALVRLGKSPHACSHPHLSASGSPGFSASLTLPRSWPFSSAAGQAPVPFPGTAPSQ